MNFYIKRAEIDDFQSDLARPPGVDRRGGQVDQESGTCPGTLAIHKTDEVGILFRRAHDL